MKILFLILIFMISLFGQENLEEVSLQLKWKYQFQFAGFIAAKEKGFYQEVGLNVALKEFDSSTNIINEVQKGEVTFGVGDSTLILESMKGIPVVALLAIFQQSPFVLMGLKSQNLNALKDIEGKEIALFKSTQGITIEAMLKSNGITYIRKPVKDKFNKLINKNIDLISAYTTNEVYVAKEMGLDVITFNPRDYGFEAYGDILFTSKKMLKRNPELVKKMYNATTKGWEYAFSHIDEIVELVYQKYNTLHKNREALKYEAEALKKISGYGTNFGEIDKSKIKSIAQVFSFMKKGKYDLANLDNFIYKDPKSEIALTQDELAYLKNKKIKVCVHPDLYPLEFIKDGKHKGITADFMQLIIKEYPFNFELVLAENDEEVFQNVFTDQCDLKSAVLHQYNLVSKYMDETNIIATDPFVLITANNKPFIENISLLKGKKIAVRQISFKNFIKDQYPLLDIMVIPDIEKIIDQLKSDKIYGFIDLSLFANTIIPKYGSNTLKVNTKLLPHVTKGVIGISNKEPQLLTIMNKLLKTISKNEIDNIKTRWAIQTYHQIVDYTLAWKILTVSLLAILLIFYWTFKYKREINRRKIAENNLRQLNLSLKDAVKTEVEKNREKDKQLLQQSRLAQMGEMISMIAHQWRQPLAAISASSASIELKASMGKLDNDTAQQKARDISDFSQHLSHTIDDFRDFFKPNKVKEKMTFSKIIESSLKIIHDELKTKNILLETDYKCKGSIHVYVNELRQVTLNLIKNAEDALVEKEIKNPTIIIRCYSNEHEAVLEISDNAGGVPEEIIDKIFDPYFSTKTQKDGTGLGLYMSKTIIKEHCGGVLSVTNAEDGAIFKIQLSTEGSITDG